MRDQNDHGKKPSRWDQMPEDVLKRKKEDMKEVQHQGTKHSAGGDKETEVSLGRENDTKHKHHDSSSAVNSRYTARKDFNVERKPVKSSGYMRAWNDDNEEVEAVERKGGHYQHHREEKHARSNKVFGEGSRYSERNDTHHPFLNGGRSHPHRYGVNDEGREDRKSKPGDGRERKYSRYEGDGHYKDREDRPRLRVGPTDRGYDNGEREKDGHYKGHRPRREDPTDRGYKSRDNGELAKADGTRVVRGDDRRGRKHTRSETPESSRSRDESSSSNSSESRSQSRSFLSRSESKRGKKEDGKDGKYEVRSVSRKASKRKHRYRSRSPSSEGSETSSSEDERERKKKRKEKRKKSKRKDKAKDREERRSVLTGKKIKLKVKKDKDDHERDANREQLLQFLNSAYE